MDSKTSKFEEWTAIRAVYQGRPLGRMHWLWSGGLILGWLLLLIHYQHHRDDHLTNVLLGVFFVGAYLYTLVWSSLGVAIIARRRLLVEPRLGDKQKALLWLAAISAASASWFAAFILPVLIAPIVVP